MRAWPARFVFICVERSDATLRVLRAVLLRALPTLSGRRGASGGRGTIGGCCCCCM